MPLNREEDLLRNTSILRTFYPQITFPWGGAMTFIISCLLTLQMLYSPWDEDVNERRTMTGANQ